MKAREISDKIASGRIYQETYTIRTVGRGISTSIPKAVVERKARELGIPVEKFLKEYAVEVYFDEFGEFDLAYKFVKKEAKKP